MVLCHYMYCLWLVKTKIAATTQSIPRVFPRLAAVTRICYISFFWSAVATASVLTNNTQSTYILQLTAPSSWCSFLHSFSFFRRSSDVAFLFLLEFCMIMRSFLHIISASLFTAWVFKVFSMCSCFLKPSVASSMSLLLSLDFSSSTQEFGTERNINPITWNSVLWDIPIIKINGSREIFFIAY